MQLITRSVQSPWKPGVGLMYRRESGRHTSRAAAAAAAFISFLCVCVCVQTALQLYASHNGIH